MHRVRQAALDAQYLLHPERFPNGPPKAALPPAEVHINPLESLAIPLMGNSLPVDDPLLATQISDGASRRGEDAATRDASLRDQRLPS